MKNIVIRNSKRYIAMLIIMATFVTTTVVYAGEAQPEAVEAVVVEEATEVAREGARVVMDEIKAQAEAEAAQRAAEEAEAARVAHRQEIVDYALQFVGNPYVYGGTSLTNGADCSGFVQSVFKNFGYELPRVASAQAYAGQQKTLEELEIGDLLFYGYGGINHVAIYIGDGQIVHASTSATGIKVSDYNYNQPCMVASYLA